MERVPRVVYTKEFKEEAVKMVTEAGLSISEVANRVSVSKSTIAYWVKLAKKGALFGWWFPEEKTGVFGWDKSNINVLTRSEPPYDPGIGTSDLRGIPCRVYAE